jgi:ribosome biogenesis protein ERB1
LLQINIDIETLIPKLPKPKDLQPYPTTCFMEYRGHTAAVSTLTTDSSGQWLASGIWLASQQRRLFIVL